MQSTVMKNLTLAVSAVVCVLCSRLLFVYAVNETKSTKLTIQLYLRTQFTNCSVLVTEVRVPTTMENSENESETYINTVGRLAQSV